MSFNSLMTLLTRSVAEILEERPTVIELGNQTFNASNVALDAVIQRSEGIERINLDGLKRMRQLSREARAFSFY